MTQQNGAYNDYGRCTDSETWQTRDADANAIGDTFRGAVSNFPLIGGLFAGLVPSTYTNNAIRYCPGATIDHTTGYTQETILASVVLALVVIYLILPR